VLLEGAGGQGFLAADRYVVERAYRPKAMADLLAELAPDLVVLEQQQPMPGQGVTSTYSTGYGFGLWEGVCAGLGLPALRVRPQRWQKVVLAGCPGEGKERAVRAVEALLPDFDLTPGRRRKPHEGLADACCLALYGIQRGAGG